MQLDEKQKREFNEHLARLLTGKIAQTSRTPLAVGWNIHKSVLKLDNEIEARTAFFSGAQYLYALLMNALSPGADVETADMSIMMNIDAELHKFYNEMAALTVDKPQGQG